MEASEWIRKHPLTVISGGIIIGLVIGLAVISN